MKPKHKFLPGKQNKTALILLLGKTKTDNYILTCRDRVKDFYLIGKIKYCFVKACPK